jgi:3-methyladenine DNA glycosylase/8-oxoguanine DNA glycosylase
MRIISAVQVPIPFTCVSSAITSSSVIAGMILIFTLGRPDVLPVDDLAIRVAAQQHYGLAERPKRDALLRIGEPWRPWRSLASRYLWRSLGKTPAVGPTPGPS